MSDYFDWILKIILVLVAILIIYWFIQLLTGGSPTLGQFNSALIVLITGFLFKIYRELGEIKTELKHKK